MKKAFLITLFIAGIFMLAGCQKEASQASLDAPKEHVIEEKIIDEVITFEDVTTYW